MAQVKAKAREASLVQVDDLTGGVDLRRTPSLLKPNRARVLRNWSLQEPGALTVFPGWSALTTEVGVPIIGARRIYLSTADPFTVAATSDGTVYHVSDAGVLYNLGEIVQSSVACEFVYDRNLVAVFDGAGVPQKTTSPSVAWTQMGITPPTAAPTLAGASGTGLVDGHTYEVSYGYRDDGLGHESNGSAAATLVVSGANRAITVTMARSDDEQVDTLTVYARDVTAGESVRRRVGTVVNPAAGDATYNITSNTWSAGVEVPTDRDVPSPMDFAVVWKNRWWGKDATVGNRLRFTQVFEPQSWPALFYLDIPFTAGDTIKALVPLGDTLVVFGSSGVFLVIGQTSLDFEVRPSAGAIAGALGRRAVCILESGIVHAAASGVFLFDGASDRLLSWDIDPAWRDLVSNSSASTLNLLGAVYHEPRKEVRIAVPRLYPTGTWGEWVLDLSRTKTSEEPAWTSTTRSIQGYISWDGPEVVAGNLGRLFSWAFDTSVISEESVGLSANGADMVAEYEGPALTLGLPMVRWIDCYGEYKTSDGLYSMEFVVDEESVLTTTVGIGGSGDVYGTAVYGAATYAGSGRRMFVTNLPLTAEGRTLTLRSIYRGQDAFAHYTYATGVVPEAVPRGIV